LIALLGSTTASNIEQELELSSKILRKIREELITD
jgi:hypothetical protein